MLFSFKISVQLKRSYRPALAYHQNQPHGSLFFSFSAFNLSPQISVYKNYFNGAVAGVKILLEDLLLLYRFLNIIRVAHG
jgi:hypothetical protein